MINWSDMVKEYKKQHDNPYYINEFVEGLVPINHYEILKVFNNMNYKIQEHHVGRSVWEVMSECIFNDYRESFSQYWDGFDEDEEE
mgnify:FL=1